MKLKCAGYQLRLIIKNKKILKSVFGGIYIKIHSCFFLLFSEMLQCIISELHIFFEIFICIFEPYYYNYFYLKNVLIFVRKTIFFFINNIHSQKIYMLINLKLFHSLWNTIKNFTLYTYFLCFTYFTIIVLFIVFAYIGQT